MQDADLPAQRERNDASGADLLGRLLDAPAVDADMAFLNDVLGDGAALRQPDEEQKAVDPQRRSRLFELGQFGECM